MKVNEKTYEELFSFMRAQFIDMVAQSIEKKNFDIFRSGHAGAMMMVEFFTDINIAEKLSSDVQDYLVEKGYAERIN